MSRYGGLIPGIRAERPTTSYVLNRIAWPGSLHLGLFAFVPTIALIAIGASVRLNSPSAGSSS